MNSSSMVKTILFWMSIILLGVMLWKLVSADGSGSRENEISYSDFMAKVDAGGIKEATLYLGQNSYELWGRDVRSGRGFRTTVFKEASPGAIEKLREEGVQVKVKEAHSSDWGLLLLNGLPLLLLVGFCLFLMRRMQGNKWRATLATTPNVRTGIGYDLHRLEYGKPLIIGGIELPFDKGPV
ncbi:MAG TPA: ATP-dependent metallopeptidase FtsH/Yme1/Tma family protein, partial [Candidatus Acidoferrum sp.]